MLTAFAVAWVAAVAAFVQFGCDVLAAVALDSAESAGRPRCAGTPSTSCVPRAVAQFSVLEPEEMWTGAESGCSMTGGVA